MVVAAAVGGLEGRGLWLRLEEGRIWGRGWEEDGWGGGYEQIFGKTPLSPRGETN